MIARYLGGSSIIQKHQIHQKTGLHRGVRACFLLHVISNLDGPTKSFIKISQEVVTVFFEQGITIVHPVLVYVGSTFFRVK